jgi:internalin A
MRFRVLLPCALAYLVAGCDDAPTEKPATPTATATLSAVATASAPAPEKPKKPKKTAEDCPKDKSVNVEDEAIDAEIRRKAEKPTGDLTTADLGKLRSLNLSQVRLEQLDPCLFPHMTNLRELFLGPGEYDDLSVLSDLTKLESLRASISKVKDLKPLEGMTKMDRLDLGRTQVEDLSPLTSMTALTELMLDDSQVEDVSPLVKLEKLERLSIQRTKVKNVQPLQKLENLKFLYVNGSPAQDELVALGQIRKNGTKVFDR